MWTEVDGVPVVWTNVPGPLRAALCFGAGTANETAPTHGISHLVEHLALHGMHDRTYHLNGFVDLTRTVFHTSGRPEEVTEFLGSVCARLRDLPTERVEVERGVLRIEAEGRSTSYRDALLGWRYGARAHGLAGLGEYGLRWLGADAVRWWAAQRFTRQNAVLWMTGRPPAGLRLDLADGPRPAATAAVPVEEVIPGWSPEPAAGVAMAGVVTRSHASSMAISVLLDELNRVLRFERGLTYGVTATYDRLDARDAHVVLSADGDRARHEDLASAFLEVHEGLCANGVPQPAVDRVRAMRARQEEDDVVMSYLDSAAIDHLMGREKESYAQVRAGAEAVRLDEAGAAVRAIAASALYLVPEGVSLPATRYPRLPLWSAAAVVGDPYPSTYGHGSLLVGRDGISRVEEDTVVTVRWADTVASLYWEDGARHLVGRDGFRLTVVPADWRMGKEVVERIDGLVPQNVHVPMGTEGPSPWARQDEGQETQQATQHETRREPRRARTRPLYAWIAIVFGFLAGIAILTGGLAGPSPATATREEVTRGDATGLVVIGLAVLAGTAYGCRVQVRRLRAGQR